MRIKIEKDFFLDTENEREKVGKAESGKSFLVHFLQSLKKKEKNVLKNFTLKKENIKVFL